MLQAQLMALCSGKHVYTSLTVPNVVEIHYSLPLSFFNLPLQLMERILQTYQKETNMLFSSSSTSDFDFNIVIQDKQAETFSPDLQDEFPDDVLHQDDAILCFSSRGSLKHNYDQFDYIKKDNYILAAVYDGHGGPAVSLYLKQKLLKSISQHADFTQNVSHAFTECINQIEDEVIKQFQPTCGSTLLIVLWRNDQIYVVSVGDGLCFGFESQDETFSGIFLRDLQVTETDYNEKPKLRKSLASASKKQLNEIHNLQSEEQRKKVKSRGGLILRQKNSYRVDGELNLSRSIGDSKYKKWISAVPSIKKYSHKFSHLLIASDGLGKTLCEIKNPEQVYELVYNPPYMKDNSTFLMIRNPSGLQQCELN